SAIMQSELLPGDVMNLAGTHVAMFSHLLASGEPVFYESGGYNVHLNSQEGWSHVSGYTPRRYSKITGSSASDPVGSAAAPIVISSFPFADSRDTSQSLSDVMDRCSLAPSTSEAGPEYIYQATFSQPGTLTVTVSDDVSSDIDVHLYAT